MEKKIQAIVFLLLNLVFCYCVGECVCVRLSVFVCVYVYLVFVQQHVKVKVQFAGVILSYKSSGLAARAVRAMISRHPKPMFMLSTDRKDIL